MDNLCIGIILIYILYILYKYNYTRINYLYVTQIVSRRRSMLIMKIVTKFLHNNIEICIFISTQIF